MKVDIFNTDKKYSIIYADPPWRYKVWSRDTGLGRSAEAHYNTMEKEEIQKLTEKFNADYSELAERYRLQCAIMQGEQLANGNSEIKEKSLSKEEFLKLEAEYNAFRKYFEACWKETKKQIRRKELWGK